MMMLCAVAANAQTVSGSVRDADSVVPLTSMVVAAYTAGGTLQSQTTTNATGAYQLSVPAAEAMRILAYDPTGQYATSFNADAPSFEESPTTTVNNGGNAAVDFRLHKSGTVTGLVTTSGGVRQGMTVAAYNLSGTRRSFTKTDATGQCSMVLPPGNYKMVAYDDDGLFAPAFFNAKPTFTEADVVTIVAGRSVGTDFFVQPGARVAGSVKNTSGTPVPAVAVLAYTAAGEFVAVATTGDDGRFALTLPAGSYRFIAVDNSSTYAAEFFGDQPSFEQSPAMTLTAGQERPNVNFTLEPGGLVEGHVLDSTTGIGIAGITVAAYNTNGTERTFVNTDGNGRFVLLLPAGNFRIAAFDPALKYAAQFYVQQQSFAHALAVTSAVGQTTTLQPFTLSLGGTISGLVTNQVNGVPVPGAVVAAYGADGELVTSATTTSNGRYRLILPPGSYRLVAFDPQFFFAPAFSGGATSFETETASVVTTGNDSTVDFALRRGTLVRGNAVDEAHSPIANIEITAFDLNGNQVASATTLSDGSFQMSLVPGTYKFVAADPTGRYKASFFGGATFSSATPVAIDATGAPRLTLTLQLPSKHRAIRR